MPRSSWKGYLKISLVSVPVRGFNATTSASEIHLNQLHADCHSRIKYQKVCPIHGEVAKNEIVMGYEYAEDQYVVVDPGEIEQLRTEADHAINVDAIIPPRSIDTAYFTDKTYYLVPDGAVGHKPFALIQKCLADDDLQAVARVVLFGREEIVLLRPVDNLLSMTALKYDARVTKPSVLKDEVAQPSLEREEVTLTKTLLKAFERKKFSIASYQDEYAEKLRQLIESKVEGKEVVSPPPTDEPKVINLMDALRKSVAAAQSPTSPGSTAARKPRARTMVAQARKKAKPKPKRKTG